MFAGRDWPALLTCSAQVLAGRLTGASCARRQCLWSLAGDAASSSLRPCARGASGVRPERLLRVRIGGFSETRFHSAERRAAGCAFVAGFLAPVEAVWGMAQEGYDVGEIAGRFVVDSRVVQLQVESRDRIEQACSEII